MKVNPTISVIIPVYNAAKTLNRCLNSIIAQDFKDFEVLLVDDGSTDDSGKICDEYMFKDERLKVFHKKNGGASSKWSARCHSTIVLNTKLPENTTTSVPFNRCLTCLSEILKFIFKPSFCPINIQIIHSLTSDS